MDHIVLEMKEITKQFPGIKALDRVSMQLRQGEILALLGENGAGKSTLMSVLFGLYQADSGKLYLHGKEINIHSPKEATNVHIGMVHQHFKLVPAFTVLENIILGVEDHAYGILQKQAAKQRIEALSELYGLDIQCDAKVADCSVGMQQRIEILKMLYRDNEVLIFDEPTAVLTPQEIETFMQIMKKLAQEGKSIIFISHKLQEIKAVADRCIVLRKGKVIASVEVDKVSKEELSMMMVGRKLDQRIQRRAVKAGKEVLRLQNVSLHREQKAVLHLVNLVVHAGEIVSIAGIDGNGQSELIQAICGLIRVSEGRIFLKTSDITKASISQRIEEGLCCIPEDRQKHGLVLDFSLQDNLILKAYNKKPYAAHGFFSSPAIARHATSMIRMYDIRSSGRESQVRAMSGGNQQKVIIAREIATNPDCLIAVQPTRGLDVGAISFIHQKLMEERNAGKAILLISYELDEVMQLSDRMYVMFQGKLTKELDPKHLSAEEIGLYMSGTEGRDGYEA